VKAIAEKADEPLFFFKPSLIFEMPISGGSYKSTKEKDRGTFFFGTCYMAFCFSNFFLLYGRIWGCHFFVS
jgi:hypothetical protein